MRASPFLALLALGACRDLPTSPDPGGLARRVVIHRDGWGVPHVLGETDAATLFGYAYARAEDELSRISQATYLMLGRNSEILGEAGLAWDRLVAMLEIPARARASYATLAPGVRELVDAAAAGLNLYLASHPDAAGAQLLPRYEPWQLLAHDYAWHLYAAAEELREVLPEVAPPSASPVADGSNAWALAPSRTSDGRALLLANPHIALEEVYEGHLDSEEGLRVSGMNAFGRDLVPILGHNGSVAWTLTVNQPDVVDLYELRFDHPDDPLAYRYGDGWRQAEVRTTTLGVRQPEGGVEERELRWLVTHHGPLVGRRNGLHLALKVAGLERRGALETFLAMARANDLDALWSALESGGLLFHNVVAADAGGRIGYVYGGLVPRRDPAFDWSQPVDGADPRTEWRGYHPFSDLPQEVDPASGWLQNCNGSPFGVTEGVDALPGDFPTYLVGPDLDDPRSAMSRSLLSREAPYDLAALAGAAFDERVHGADTWIRELGRDARAMQRDQPARFSVLEEPLLALEQWDRRASADSAEATLFFLFHEHALGLVEGDSPVLLAAFERTLFELHRDHSSWSIRWGQVNRHQRPTLGRYPHSDARLSWPVGGGAGSAGIQWCFQSRRHEGALLRYGFHGSSYIGAFSLGNPTHALSVVPYGASRDPASPHHDDQAPLYASGRLKPAWWTRADVLARSQRSYSPGE